MRSAFKVLLALLGLSGALLLGSALFIAYAILGNHSIDHRDTEVTADDRARFQRESGLTLPASAQVSWFWDGNAFKATHLRLHATVPSADLAALWAAMPGTLRWNAPPQMPGELAEHPACAQTDATRTGDVDYGPGFRLLRVVLREDADPAHVCLVYFED